MTSFDEEEFKVKSERTCPRCNVTLYLVERNDEVLDVCRKCNGIWFDPTELDDLMGKGSPIELLIKITGSLKGESMSCPNCSTTMVTKEIYDVYVDLCEECKGIWMDRGETEKVWEMDERTRHPFGMQPEDIDPRKFWDNFKIKYQGFESTED